MNKETISVLELLQSDNTKFSMLKTDNLKSGFDISPQDFLKFAEQDLSLKYEHNIVNALSNAKRALDCQIDTILLSLGFYKVSQEKYWGFPKKLDLINELDILAPRVLRKINKQRNLLEHKFVKPTKEIVEDFLDISMLFIASTDRYTLSFKPLVQLKNTALSILIIIENDYLNDSLKIMYYDINSDPVNGKMLHNVVQEVVHNAIKENGRSKSRAKSEYIEPQPLQEFCWNSNDEDYKLIVKEYLKIIR